MKKDIKERRLYNINIQMNREELCQLNFYYFSTASMNKYKRKPFVFIIYSKTHMHDNSQRGVGRGQWGEGSTGATIKDAWTKSRGRVEVGEGGGIGWDGVEG